MAGDKTHLNIELLPTKAFRPLARNPRSHSREQIQQIAKSIHQFGFNSPILIDADKVVIAGHGRLEAAKLLGIKRIPAIRLDHLTEAEKRAYVIADKKLAENAGWDQTLLALELQYISELDIELDLTLTGFEPAEIDLSLQGLESATSTDEADEIPEPDRSRPSVTRAGDLWMLGQRHRLLCADARRDGSFTRLLTGQGAELVVSDPPYNLSVARIGGRGAIRHAEFVMASGEMSETAFTGFLSTTLGHLVRHSVVGSLHFIFLDWRHIFELLSAARKLYAEFKNLCVWNKSNGGMGSLYRSKHELVFVFKNGTAPHINNVELGRFGRNRTNVWDYAGVNSFREGRLEELAAHPSPKPVELVSDLILDASKRNGVVLDCFGGAGTTVIAAEKTGRRGYLMELDSAYVDASIRRFEKLTGMQAIHADTGLTFAQVERHRLDASSSGDRTSQRRHRAIVDDSTHPSTPLGSVSTLQNRPTHPDSAPGPNQKTIRPLKPGFVKGSHRIALREDAKKA